MVVRHTSISDSYAVLGLEKGASLESVKSAYKQLALRTHPDKNPDNPDATVQFQQVGEAYNRLLKHLDTSTPPPMPPGFNPFDPFHSSSRGPGYDFEDDFDSDEYYDSEGEYEEEEDLDFFMFLFEEMLNGRANRYAGARFQSRGRDRETESEEQYKARIQRQREEQAAAARRRKEQEEAWKLRRQMERENEVRQGTERRKQKAEARKAEAEAERRSAEQKVRSQQQKSQTLRSSVFAAARRGESAKVKKGVWEDSVDAAGGEIKPGMEEFVQPKPTDPKQTLLHLAVTHGDAELTEWLDRHNAEAEECDSQGRTAFHVALQHGHLPIIRYFFDTYPPKEEDSEPVLHVSTHPDSKPLLRLALDSGEPEVVWLVLDAGLADSKAVRDVWAWIAGNERQARAEFGRVGKGGKGEDDKFEETKHLLMSWGGFTPPPTPTTKPTPVDVEVSPSPPTFQQKKGKKTKKQQSQPHLETHTPLPSQTQTPPETPQSTPTPPSSQHSPPTSPFTNTASQHNGGRPPFPGRGRGGRGRGRGRGRGAPAFHAPA